MTDDSASINSTLRAKISTGYDRLDEALQGGFLAGSAIVLSAPASDEVPLLLRNFLIPDKGKALLLSRSLSAAQAVSHLESDNLRCLICSEKPVPPSKNVMPGKGIENLTELNFQITETIGSVQPKRIAIDILSDILLRHKALQTRKWLTELLERLRAKNITTLAVLNPYMHSNEDVQAVVDLFDGSLEIVEEKIEGRLGKLLRIRWMHDVETIEKQFPLLDLAPRPQSSAQQLTTRTIAKMDLDRRRIAILPFTNISPDPKDEYFADGMTEELISTMSRISGLKVIARTSVMGYKGGQKKINEIARELEVGTVLEGSVRKAGNRLRITIQLIDPRANDHLWAESYDRDLEDVFAIQSDIARRVAEAMQARLSKSESDAIAKESTSSLEAYALYLRAMQLLHEGSAPSLKHAIALLEHAISKDPGFARAYAVLSEAWGILAEHEEFLVATRKAEAAARKSLELAPDSAEAHAAMAMVNNNLDRFDEAASEAEKAIQINPNLSEVYQVLGSQYLVLGKLDQALNAHRKEYELDPLSFTAGANLARVLRMAGRYSEAIDVLSKARELNPRNPRVYSGLAHCYALSKDFAKAQEMLDIGLQIDSNDLWLREQQGVLYALTGRRKKAEDVLQGILSDKNESNRLWGQLNICAALGDLDEAFKALMRMAETQSWPSMIKFNPVFEDLRKDPRFQEFCAKVGIPA